MPVVSQAQGGASGIRSFYQNSLKGKPVLDLLSRPRSEARPRRRGRGFAGMFFRSAAAVALVAGSVSISLVVSEPAHADGVGIAAAIAPEVVEGATEVAVGTLAAITPVGWAIIGGTALFALAYATKDSWEPWVAGQFGAGTSSQPSGTPTGGTIQPHTVAGLTTLLSTTPPDQHTVRVNAMWAAQSGSVGSFHFAYVQQCQYAANTAYPATGGLGTVSSFAVLSQQSAPMNQNLDFRCQAFVGGQSYLGTPVSLKVGLAGTDGLPNLPSDGSVPSGGPTTEVMAGTAKTGQFNPQDPGTKYTTSVECVDNYGVKSTITADSFGNQGGVNIPSCGAAGKGHGTGVISITGYPPGSPQGTNVYSSTITADPTKPLCNPALASGGCTMQIEIDGKPCVVGDVQCENWITVDQNDPNHTRVVCMIGPYTAALSACNLLERAYYPGGAPANVPNTDGDPSTSSGTDLNGNPMPQPQPVNPGTVPGAPGVPVPGASPNPTSTNSSDCFPNGWGVFNPVEWIQKPMGCALSWAFVPQGTTMTQLETQVQTDVNRVGFGPVETAVAGMFTPLGAGGAGCQGPPIVFAMDGVSQTIYPFNACTSPMSIAAGICNALFTVAFVVGGGLALLRAISSAFGYNFSFRMGGGGE